MLCKANTPCSKSLHIQPLPGLVLAANGHRLRAKASRGERVYTAVAPSQAWWLDRPRLFTLLCLVPVASLTPVPSPDKIGTEASTSFIK